MKITFVLKFIYVNLLSQNRTWSFKEYLQEDADFTWRVSDCEELVGVDHRE